MLKSTENPQKRLIKEGNNSAFSAVKRFFARKVKKPIFYRILSGGALLLFLLTPTFLANAISFSSLFNVSQGASPASTGYNSQTIPLLSPAVNIDPNPAKGGGDITVVGGAALEAQAGPSGTAADIEEWPTSSQVSVYTVHQGDTLGGIAKLFSVSVNTIVWANNIKNGVIHPGDVLVILPITGIKHTVVKGDTLASLTKKYKAAAADITQYNGLDSSLPLAVGSSIIIPNGELAAAPVSANSHRITAAPREPYLGGSGPAIAGYYSWPVGGGVITQSLHGWNAVDIGAHKGTPIYAAAAGVVIVARGNGAWNGGYGSYVVVQHGNGTQTLYAHMSKMFVSAGDAVLQGQTIGLVGATGEATGAHLHFEVRGAANPFASLLLGSGNNF